ncbi:MAG: hypothetical protein LBF79_06170 [Dysgonamonadaceae bacterium]|jgi:hypothetical protein|nr:hypothetical protein [Dysgonamonadaceae bacterium]
MAGKDYMPSTVEGFRSWSDNFMTKLTAIGAEDYMPPPTYHELNRLQADYTKKYDLSEVPETRTPVTVRARTNAQDLFKKALRSAIKSFLTYNPKVTDELKVALGLPIHKTDRSSIDVPRTHVILNVKALDYLRLVLQFHDQELTSLGDRKKWKRPYGYNGAYVVYAILPSPPESIAELNLNILATRTPHIMEFEEGSSGKRVYFAICWQNEKGQNGPFSPIQSAIIP